MKIIKKTIALILVSLFFIGCSSSNDGNGNTTTTVVPIAPNNLIGQVISATQINLSWTDNSTNEVGFKIERKVGTGAYVVIGSTATDVSAFNDTGLSVGITYTYRIYSYNSVGNSPNYSNEVILTISSVMVLPTIITTTSSSITQSSAFSGGTISNDGGAAVTSRGCVWSTSPNPTIALSTKTTDGNGIGVFVSNITSLLPNTTYYLRAYATNSIGTAYGININFTTMQIINASGPSVTDIEGNVYQTIQNCNQIWTKTNLNVSKYTDGTIIPQVTDPTQWLNLRTGAWCYYNNVSANGTVHGKLYNWYAVAGIYNTASLNDPALRKKLAPIGYHIPTSTEWGTFINCLGGANVAGGKMKQIGTLYWDSPNTATNESGFDAIGSGMRYLNADFFYMGFTARYWSSSHIWIAIQPDIGNADFCDLGINSNARMLNDAMSFGYSVRCVKD
ncbi:MAG: FISUMP domain-containing protein [Flavobacterium sp.]